MPLKRKTFNYKALFRSAARRIWLFYGANRKEALKRANLDRYHVFCTTCGLVMPKKDKLHQVDHDVPCSESSAQITSWDDWLNRLMYGECSVLCVDCHEEKTQKENTERRAVKSLG